MNLSGELPIKVSNIMDNHKKYMAVIEKCGFSKVKVVYDEWGAVSHGFYNVEKCLEMIMRETEKMAAFFIKMVYDMMNVSEVSPMMMICLSGQHEMKTDFSGFRNFFREGVRTYSWTPKGSRNKCIPKNRKSER